MRGLSKTTHLSLGHLSLIEQSAILLKREGVVDVVDNALLHSITQALVGSYFNEYSYFPDRLKVVIREIANGDWPVDLTHSCFSMSASLRRLNQTLKKKEAHMKGLLQSLICYQDKSNRAVRLIREAYFETKRHIDTLKEAINAERARI